MRIIKDLFDRILGELPIDQHLLQIEMGYSGLKNIVGLFLTQTLSE